MMQFDAKALYEDILKGRLQQPRVRIYSNVPQGSAAVEFNYASFGLSQIQVWAKGGTAELLQIFYGGSGIRSSGVCSFRFWDNSINLCPSYIQMHEFFETLEILGCFPDEESREVLFLSTITHDPRRVCIYLDGRRSLTELYRFRCCYLEATRPALLGSDVGLTLGRALLAVAPIDGIEILQKLIGKCGTSHADDARYELANYYFSVAQPDIALRHIVSIVNKTPEVRSLSTRIFWAMAWPGLRAKEPADINNDADTLIALALYIKKQREENSTNETSIKRRLNTEYPLPPRKRRFV